MAPAKDDASYMSLALSLAAASRPSPNPRVGAVIVQNNRIIGQGFHRAPGRPHAEIEALDDARRSGIDVSGATIYVTLEPCCHFGRTGPCTVAIHEAGIDRVVVGMRDPDPKVSGNGIKFLREKNHPVDVGVLENECRQLLDAYAFHRKYQRPQIHLKAAVTLDGYIADTEGMSKWITGPAARATGHKLRAYHDAILVGIGTVLADNPTLNVRDAAGINPTRIVLDSQLRIPDNARLLNTPDDGPVILMHGTNAPAKRIDILGAKPNVRLLPCHRDKGGLELHNVLKHLNGLGFLGVLVEGGSAVHGAFIQSRLADRLSLFVAAKILGSGTPWATLPAGTAIGDAITLVPESVQSIQLGSDTLIEGTFAK